MFTIFDGLLYTGKPALPGMTVMSQLVGLTSPPPAGSDGYFYIDYEPAIGTLTEVQAAVAAAAPVLASYQASNPEASFGFYALGPVLDYYGIINPSVNEPPNTPLAARNTATEPLNAACNYVLPSLYNLVGPDDPLWQTYAAGTIAEARRVSAGRPVYAFVWPQYSFGGNVYIDTPTWTAQLEWIQANCDGIVLWGGYQETWNPTAPWWLATKQVLGIGTGDRLMWFWNNPFVGLNNPAFFLNGAGPLAVAGGGSLDVYDNLNGSVALSWSPFAGVLASAYNVYVNGVLNQTVTGLSATVSGLQQTTYSAGSVAATPPDGPRPQNMPPNGVVTDSGTYQIWITAVVAGVEVAISASKTVTVSPTSIMLLTPMKRLWPFPNTGLD